MRIGRRPLFFAALAFLCLLILEPTPPEYRWVNLFAAGLALFWAVALYLEERSLRKATPLRPAHTPRKNARRDART